MVIIDSTYELSSPVLDMVSDTPVLTFGKRVQALDHQIALTGVDVSFAAAGLTGNAACIAAKVDSGVQGWISGEAVEDQNLHDFLLASANQPSLSSSQD